MLRLAFDFIIAWRETRTRPNAYILGYAMIHEYRMYLENHWKARYSFCDFIKRERFYIYLFLGLTFVVILGITVYIMAMREQLSFGG